MLKRPTEHGLFFAIFPEAHAALRTEQVARDFHNRYELVGKPLKTNRFHVSVQGLCRSPDGLPDAIVAAAREAAATVTMPAFRVAFNHAMSFTRQKSNRPLVLCGDEGIIGIEMLQQALSAALGRTGRVRQLRRNLTPHMILLYDDRSISEQPVEPIIWTVREFVLVHSLINETVHIPLARWPLRG
jgi:2'-5' RNA ligase